MAAKEKVYCGFCNEEITNHKTRHYLVAHGIDLLNKVCPRCGEEFRAKRAIKEFCHDCDEINKKEYMAQYRLERGLVPGSKAKEQQQGRPVGSGSGAGSQPKKRIERSFVPLGCEGCVAEERNGLLYWYRDGRVVGVDRLLDVLAVAVLPAYELAYSNGGEEIEERVKGKAGRPKKVFADGVPSREHPWKLSYPAAV